MVMMRREQKRQLAALEYSRKQKEKEEALAASQMAKALTGGVSWGMGDDGEVSGGMRG